jgi:transcriptional regulator with XRE-family HTH domain
MQPLRVKKRRETLRRIAFHLRRVRTARDLSRSEIARKSAVEPIAIKQIEDAERMPGVDLMWLIAEAVGMQVGDFLQPVNGRRPRRKNSG